MNIRDCYNCKHAILSLFMAETEPHETPYEEHPTDCSKGHWEEIEAAQFTTEWNNKIKEIAQNCNDFQLG